MRARPTAALVFLALAATACTGGEDETPIRCCSYDERSTDGCDGAGFGPWQSLAFEFDADDYVISAEEVCDNVTQSGLFCEGGCCIDYEYRNVILKKGECSS